MQVGRILLVTIAATAAAVSASQAPPAASTAQPHPSYRSRIVVHDLRTGAAKVVYEADGIWEAPNWSRDGAFLLVNSGGRLYRLRLDSGEPPQPLALDPSLRANNDHDFSPDEVTGGQGTINVNSWSPDSTRFAYVTYMVQPVVSARTGERAWRDN